MAITKIIKIKGSPKACIRYAINDKKTNEGAYVSYFQCQKKDADFLFSIAQSMNKRFKNDEESICAYHIIQSFAKTDKLTPEEANRIGMEMMEKLFDGKYAFVCSTHTDHDHLHNHIVMSAAARDMTGHKLRDNLTLLHKLQKVNDDICRERGLNVIEKKKGRGKHYKEWLDDIQNPNGSKKQQLRTLIDSQIKVASDFDDFLERMKAAGTDIAFGNSKKYGRVTKYRLPNAADKDKWHRGYNLGAGYSDEMIAKRIANRIHAQEVREAKRLERIEKRKAEHAAMTKADKAVDHTKLKIDRMIDTSTDNVTASNYNLEKWKNIQNAKRAEVIKKTLREKYGINYTQIKSKINSLEAENNRMSATIKSNKESIEDIRNLIECCQVYMQTFEINKKFENSKDQDRYYRRHDSELNAYAAASAQLDRTMVIKSILEDKERGPGYIATLQKELSKLEELQSIYKQDIKKNEKAINELRSFQKELNVYHNRSNEEI